VHNREKKENTMTIAIPTTHRLSIPRAAKASALQTARATTTALDATSLVVDVTVVRSETIGGDPEFAVGVSPSYLALPYGEEGSGGTVYQITFTITSEDETVTFQNPPLSFFDPAAPAIVQSLADKSATILWANVDPLTAYGFDYRLRMKATVGLQTIAIISDPTVENQPPTPKVG
jgi:hypothetical protein